MVATLLAAPVAFADTLPLPSASTIFASSSSNTLDTFTYLWPIVALVVGFIIGVLVVNKVIHVASKAAHRTVGRGRRG